MCVGIFLKLLRSPTGTTARGQRYNRWACTWEVQPQGITPGAVVGPVQQASGTTAEEKLLHQKELKVASLYTERKVMVGDEKSVRAMILPTPSDVDSLLIVWVSYDQGNKHAENSVFDLFL